MFQGTIQISTAMPAEAYANGDTLFDLGMMFSTGRTGSVDLVAAHKWFNLAALKGSEEAKSWRAQLSREMDNSQIAQAQKLAREWLNIFRD